MSVTESWVAGREAVHAVMKFALDQTWIFMEVPGHADFGKDGYVDMVSTTGAVTGSSFAVQIKGGRSRRRSGGYRIDGTASNRQLWAASTMPVIGLVWDPAVSRLYWTDLTATLHEHGTDADLLVASRDHLDAGEGLRRFKKYIGSVAHRQALILDLVSPEPEFQMAGIAAAYHIGRTDGRALVLLRRLLPTLDAAARRSAVWALASAVPHPDIFGSIDGSPDHAACALLAATLQWEIEEIMSVLELIDDGIDRGMFGQHVHQLLVMDADHVDKVRRAAIEAARAGRFEAASWALIMAVYWAGEDGPTEFTQLVAAERSLANTWAAQQMSAGPMGP